MGRVDQDALERQKPNYHLRVIAMLGDPVSAGSPSHPHPQTSIQIKE